MTIDTTALFRPFKSDKLTLKNRIVMAPMTRQQSPGGVPDEKVAAYYQRRAVADVGLIITEGVTVDYGSATNHPDIPTLLGKSAQFGWQKVVDAVHVAGGKIAPQLWHQGLARAPGTGPDPDAPSLSPSGIMADGKVVAEPMTRAQIDDVIDKFAVAAGQAKALGFDALEIHGAHGYLIDQFLWQGTNQRSDDFGGSLLKRTQFAVEIIKAVRATVGNAFPISFRFSQWKQQDYQARLAESPQQLEQLLTPLVEAGVDIFHASTRRFWEREFEGSDLNLAAWTRKTTGMPTITVGSVGLDNDFLNAFQGSGAGTVGIDTLIDQMKRGDYDLVAIGRALLANPDWAVKVGEGDVDELRPFSPDVLVSLD